MASCVLMFKLYLKPDFPKHGQVATCVSGNYFHLPLALGLQVLTLNQLAKFWGKKNCTKSTYFQSILKTFKSMWIGTSCPSSTRTEVDYKTAIFKNCYNNPEEKKSLHVFKCLFFQMKYAWCPRELSHSLFFLSPVKGGEKRKKEKHGPWNLNIPNYPHCQL